MTTIEAFLAGIRARAAAHGLADDPTDALRNKGARRTPAKRELLRRAEARARSAGCKPVPAHY